MYISEYVISIHIDVVAHGSVEIRSFGSVINVVLQDDSFNFEISQNDPVINEPTIEYKAICPWHTRLYYIEKSPRIRVTPSNKSLNLRII